MKPPPKLDDLIRDMKQDVPKPDWKSIDDKLFARIEREPRTFTEDEAPPNGRVIWIGAALTLAAAAAALLFMHPSASVDDSRAELSPTGGALMSGAASVHGAVARVGTQLAEGDRIEASQDTYFESQAARWVAQGGSVLRVEHTTSPLVLSLEKGATEAQVTPVPSGEAFAIDITASSGSMVRVAVHGTHLRVERDGDRVLVDLSEGVVSIGAPPRRGSTLGTLVTAPAHIELDARDLGTIRVDHAAGAVRAPEAVTATPHAEAETAAVLPLLNQPSSQSGTSSTTVPGTLARTQLQSQKPASNTAAPIIEPTWLRSSDEVVSALQTCIQNAVHPNATFSTTLKMTTLDDGRIQEPAYFDPPLPPEARDCAPNVLYKRTKMANSNDSVSLTIEVKH